MEKGKKLEVYKPELANAMALIFAALEHAEHKKEVKEFAEALVEKARGEHVGRRVWVSLLQP